ncbi:MAG: hypothetical protein JWM32_1256 [Verrucomicrobia bacterium]|nr:hypothetical protein [Verrucomicrobiota bacterium]
MAFFDRFQKKWKHPDPAVRQEAVRGLKDQDLLGEIATNDSSDDVRSAAIDTLKDQDVLERLALSDLPCARAAGAKVTDSYNLERIAKLAVQSSVRQQAIGRITDNNLLLRISALDPDPTVRALASLRAGGADPARTYLRGTISKLPSAPRSESAVPEFSGTLDEVCHALTQDPRFFVNGELVEEEANRTASVADPTQAPWTIPLARTTIRLLAQTRKASINDTRGAEELSFYHIKVWRTAEDRYEAVAINKRTAPTSDPVAWSQASGSGPHEANSPRPSPAD